MLRIPLIEDLTRGPVPPGSYLLVEYDPESVWFAASLTMAVGWLKAGGTVLYSVMTQPPDKFRFKLNRLGVNAEELEKAGKLVLHDFYTATLGQKSKEKLAADSLKVHELSIWFAKELASPIFVQHGPELLRIRDDWSSLDRFNQEKHWVEFVLTRIVPSATRLRSRSIAGIMRGIHSKWAYSQIEASVDGIIDFKLEGSGDEVRNLMRIRSMRDVEFDGRWHTLKTRENFEVILEKEQTKEREGVRDTP